MKRKDNFVLQNVGGENLLVPTGEAVTDLNGIVTLNETGVFVWQLLSEERTLDELAASVAREFGIDQTRARFDVQVFLEEIKQFGLLVYQGDR